MIILVEQLNIQSEVKSIIIITSLNKKFLNGLNQYLLFISNQQKLKIYMNKILRNIITIIDLLKHKTLLQIIITNKICNWSQIHNISQGLAMIIQSKFFQRKCNKKNLGLQVFYLKLLIVQGKTKERNFIKKISDLDFKNNSDRMDDINKMETLARLSTKIVKQSISPGKLITQIHLIRIHNNISKYLQRLKFTKKSISGWSHKIIVNQLYSKKSTETDKILQNLKKEVTVA